MFVLLTRLFGLGSIATFFIEGGVILSVLGGGYLYVRTHYENIGYQKALHAVAAQDQAAVKEAKHASDNVAKCFSDGGSWNVSEGACQK